MQPRINITTPGTMRAPIIATAAQWARLSKYFEIQLRFAAASAEQLGIEIADAVWTYTNFHRSFGYGLPHAQSPQWQAYTAALRNCATVPECLTLLGFSHQHTGAYQGAGNAGDECPK
jgi:hypothetical protein